MSEFESDGDRRRTWIYGRIVREIVFWGLLLFSLTNALITIGFLAAGSFEGILALAVFFGFSALPSGFASKEDAAMALGLKAVEIILFAPLAYLFVSALARFVRAIGEIQGDAWSNAYRAVVGVKSLATTMLISIVAADFVRKILEGQLLDISNTLLEVLIFLVLTTYLLVLERSQRRSIEMPPR